MTSVNSKVIYWEKQGNDRMCALHCINSLLQGPYFSEQDLSAIATELDLKERQLMAEGGMNTEEYKAFVAQGSLNASDDGFFNITVLEACLKTMRISCINSNKPEMISVLDDPCTQEGYICNLSEHWFTIRKIGNIWYNLDSLKFSPTVISEFHLSILLGELKRQGYSLFVVIPFDGAKLPLPYSTSGLNSNQMYLTMAEIEELQNRGKQKDEEDSKAAQAFAQNDENCEKVTEEKSRCYLVKVPPGKELQQHKWPEKGGYVMRENNPLENSDVILAEDDEMKQAIYLSMQTYQQELQPPVEEPPLSISNLEKVCIQVRSTDGKKLMRTFLKKHKITDVFDWIEYDLLKEKSVFPPLSQRDSYFLLVQFEKRKYCKIKGIGIEIFDELHPNGKTVSDKTLEDLGFSYRESFILHL